MSAPHKRAGAPSKGRLGRKQDRPKPGPPRAKSGRAVEGRANGECANGEFVNGGPVSDRSSPASRSAPPAEHMWDHLLRPGNTNCAGCGMSIGLRWLEEALAEPRPYLVIPACCGIVTAGAFPTTAYGVPTIASTFASSPAVATGVATVARLNGDARPVVCWTGDGGTYDIGMATLSAAAERNEDIIYVCYDNEIYGNTGGQRSSATPLGVRTTTTPLGKTERKKDMMAIMAAHRVPYAATLSIAHRDDFFRKVETARRTPGFRFLLMLSPCPTGWKSEPEQSVELIAKAVRCGVFPVYEIFEGRRYCINVQPDHTPVEEYIEHQRRYTSVELDPAVLREGICDQWSYLRSMARAFPAS